MEQIQTVAVAAINEHRELLLIGGPSHSSGIFAWTIPAVSLNRDDDPIEIARRCLREAATLDASAWALLGEISADSSAGTPARIFLARDLKPITENSSARNAPGTREWVPLKSALTMAGQGVIQDSPTVFAIQMLGHNEKKSGPNQRTQPGDSATATDRDFAALLERHDKLTRRVDELHSMLAQALERTRRDFDRVDGRLVQLHARSAQALRETQSILQSRIWKALVTGGGLVMGLQSLLRGRSVQTMAPSSQPAAGSDKVSINCDNPLPDDQTPRTGRVLIRGWAISPAGIDRVEIQAGRLEPVKARYGLYRTDIARLFPNIEGALFSEYQLRLDTLFLPNGRHIVRITAFSKSGQSAELAVPILIDHLRGLANDYDRWMREFDQRDPILIRLKLPVMARQPLISILTPVYKTKPTLLERAISSVKQQSYPHWELLLVDDGSQSPEITALLTRESKLDPRIRFTECPVNRGISAASNVALSMAQGDYVALLDHDDELSQDALFHVVDSINTNPDADILYSDEDHLDEQGIRSDPFFKPDWSPDLVLAENYVCHLMVFRRSLAGTVGGFRSAVDTAQDHDLLLRMSLHAKRIVHIPRILYHWRTEVDASVVNRASFQEGRSFAASRQAVEDYLKLAGIHARVEQGRWPGRWRIRYPIPPGAEVCILMPTGGKIDLLRRCLNTLFEKTEYRHFRLGIVDNSKSGAAQHFLSAWTAERQCTVTYLDWRNRRFDFSAMNNALARKVVAESGPAAGARRQLLLFLNDDTEALTPDWLTSMVELASRPEVGAVGAKLLYPDNRIQHAGVVLGLMGICGHGLRGYSNDERVYYDAPDLVRNVSAVTGACMMVPADLFFELGGFDEQHLPVAYQDIDLCLKICERGLRVLYNPYAVLRHYEAVSKAVEDMNPRPEETQALKTRWAHILDADPFYNPNLTLTDEDYSYRASGMHANLTSQP